MLGLNLYYYELIPERIPTHFNATGKPDGYGGKITLWILFGVSVLASGILYFTGRNPHLGNYTIPITEENAPRQYQNMQRMNRTLTAVLCLCFAYIQYGIIQTALGHQDGLGLWFLLLFLSLIFGIITYFLYRAKVLE
ncbi:DUF1648 domain-containing protein [Lewinella sp. LCG006]|uniref:DUF1648 domain-containing protein n=1 Tax=Lewinella sp. LCG006 TaxID=3231911 RepID=UPI0034610466